MLSWVDSHCHLQTSVWGAHITQIREEARQAGVACCIIPSVDAGDFVKVPALASRFQDVYALGIHPYAAKNSSEADIVALSKAIHQHRHDPKCVAIGEIGLDGRFLSDQQISLYAQQLRLAKDQDLPVILHAQQSIDRVLKELRELRPKAGILHAFNGSLQQAEALLKLGFKLGMGGAVTFDNARHLRQLAKELPLEALVLETDAPDMPPQWRYQPRNQRRHPEEKGTNTPAELPKIAAVIAEIRGLSLQALAEATTQNVMTVFPALKSLIP